MSIFIYKLPDNRSKKAYLHHGISSHMNMNYIM